MPSFFTRNHEIWHYSGYKTRVFAEYFFELKSKDDLQKLSEAYIFSLENQLPFLIIGWGTNILFSKSFFPWVIIKNSIIWWEYDAITKTIQTTSSESIWNIAETLEKSYNNSIWHRFIWLPGSIGGAIFGNAGCFGLDTENNLIEVTIFNMLTGEIEMREKDTLEFSYRHSILKEKPHLFIVWAYFSLDKKIERYHSDVDNLYFREHKQPKWNSCGSFFKNPSRDISAGMLIEQVWLKGYHYGGAYWSDLHANFLMSDGESCKWEDLLELIKLTQKKVQEETGYSLINEVRIIL